MELRLGLSDWIVGHVLNIMAKLSIIRFSSILHLEMSFSKNWLEVSKLLEKRQRPQQMAVKEKNEEY
jgi:hypothetical protein